MAKEVVETIYGKYHKFEITKESGPGGYAPSRFFVYKDGMPSGLGYFDSLCDAGGCG